MAIASRMPFPEVVPLPAEPIMVGVSRTVRLSIREPACAAVARAVESTCREWGKAVRFYVELFLGHPGVFEAKKTVQTSKGEERQVPWTSMDLLTWAERVSVPTQERPDVLDDFGAACPQMPVTLRRAAINAASGAVRSHLTSQRRWAEADPKRRGKEPSLPDPHPNLTLYAGMYELDTARLRKGSCRLKVLQGRWRWMDATLALPPYALALFAESEAEQSRIAAERATQNARMAAEGRKRRTAAERERLRATPGVWLAQSSTLIVKPSGLYLHVPFVKRVELAGRAEERRHAEPDLGGGGQALSREHRVRCRRRRWPGEFIKQIGQLLTPPAPLPR